MTIAGEAADRADICDDDAGLHSGAFTAFSRRNGTPAEVGASGGAEETDVVGVGRPIAWVVAAAGAADVGNGEDAGAPSSPATGTSYPNVKPVGEAPGLLPPAPPPLGVGAEEAEDGLPVLRGRGGAKEGVPCACWGRCWMAVGCCCIW